MGFPKLGTLVKLSLGAAIGGFVADQFVVKYGPEDPTGFIEVGPGLGLDDVARAVTVALAVYIVGRMGR